MGVLQSLWKFITGTYTITRSVSNGYDVHGKSLPASVSTFTTPASVQPMTGRELLLLPEAQRAEETQWLYSPVELFTRAPGVAPDIVTIPNGRNVGESWVVDHVEHWNHLGSEFWKCRIARRNIP